jgi:hypothetical protein
VKDVARDLTALPSAVGDKHRVGRYEIVGRLARDKQTWCDCCRRTSGRSQDGGERGLSYRILQSSADWRRLRDEPPITHRGLGGRSSGCCVVMSA